MGLMETPIVVDALIKASIILAATALVAAALGRASASARHLVWTLGLVGALAAPALALALPRWEVPLVRIPEPAHVIAARAGSMERDAVAREDTSRMAAKAHGSLSQTTAAAPAGTSNDVSWVTAATGLQFAARNHSGERLARGGVDHIGWKLQRGDMFLVVNHPSDLRRIKTILVDKDTVCPDAGRH